MNHRMLKPLPSSPRRLRAGVCDWRALVESLPDPVLVVNREGCTLYANPAARMLLNRHGEGLPTLPAFEVEATTAREFEVCDAAGSVLHLEGRCAPLQWDGNEAWSVVLRNFTRRKASLERFRHAAQHDSLTGLPNRSALMRRLHAAIRRQRRRPTERFGVIFVDLDRFKAINDRHGHRIGDLVLDEVGVRLRGCLRDGDMVARIGGDEFVVLLENLQGDDKAQFVAERIRKDLDRPHCIEELNLRVEASVGVALSSAAHALASEVLEAADRAMYESKRYGRVILAD